MNTQKHESDKLSVSTTIMPNRFDSDGIIGHTIVLAVINYLQQWCCSLLWFAIVCVIGCCGDRPTTNKTISNVRQTIGINNDSTDSKTVLKLKMQLLRHLTNPQTAVLRPMKLINKYQLSRPPSPHLFDISEDDENL